MAESDYLSLLKDWLFTKSSEKKKWSIDKLGYTSLHTLKIISQMKIGENVIIKDYALKRIA